MKNLNIHAKIIKERQRLIDDQFAKHGKDLLLSGKYSFRKVSEMVKSVDNIHASSKQTVTILPGDKKDSFQPIWNILLDLKPNELNKVALLYSDFNKQLNTMPESVQFYLKQNLAKVY